MLSFPHPEAPWLRNAAVMPLASFGGGHLLLLGALSETERTVTVFLLGIFG